MCGGCATILSIAMLINVVINSFVTLMFHGDNYIFSLGYGFSNDDKTLVYFNNNGTSKPILKIIDKFVENTVELDRDSRRYLHINL